MKVIEYDLELALALYTLHHLLHHRLFEVLVAEPDVDCKHLSKDRNYNHNNIFHDMGKIISANVVEAQHQKSIDDIYNVTGFGGLKVVDEHNEAGEAADELVVD